MMKGVITIAPNETVFAVAAKMAERGIGALVIAEKNSPFWHHNRTRYCKESCGDQKRP